MMKPLRNKGFTIIELLIATVAFSVILLIITGAIIQFSKIYYKGVVESKTQETARAIVADVSQAIQFGKVNAIAPPATTSPVGGQFICVGPRTYTYVYGVPLTGNIHGLVGQDGCTSANPGMTTAALSGTNPNELLGNNMQLINFSVTGPVNDLYTVTVKIGYGKCSDMTLTCANPARQCKAITLGGQFCSVSELQATVARRLKP